MRGGLVQRCCPKCGGYFAGQLLCPNCGISLTSQDGSGSDISSLASKIRRNFPPLQASFLRRLVIGLILAQGLYYGFRELAMAGSEVLTNDAAWWDTSHGVLLGEIFQIGALIFATLVAGVAHSRAVLLGALLGLLNSAAVLGAAYQAGVLPEGVFLYSQPPLHAVAGIFGGLVGRLIWKPIQTLPLLQEAVPAQPQLPPRPVVERDAGPVSWGRVLVGAGLAFAGTVWAQTVRNRIGGLGTGGAFQGQLVLWQIATLATLFGGAFAGANTRSGLRHGLITGVLAAAALVGAQFHLRLTHFPAHEFWLDQFNINPAAGPWPGLALSAASAFIIAAVGGWLGGQLLPPTVKNRFRPYMD